MAQLSGMPNQPLAVVAVEKVAPTSATDGSPHFRSTSHLPLVAVKSPPSSMISMMWPKAFSARGLAAWLRMSPSDGPTHAVFAALGDKDIVSVIAALEGTIDRWWLAGLADASPRGLSVDAFAERLAGTAAADGDRFPGVSEALAAARREATSGARILVFGSFHTAAAALDALTTV